MRYAARAGSILPPPASLIPCAPFSRPDEPKEVKALYKRFRRLDIAQRGTLSEDDLLRIPEVVMNPLAPRMLAMFERNAEGRINFRSFARGLSVFNERATADVKRDGACGGGAGEVPPLLIRPFFPPLPR